MEAITASSLRDELQLWVQSNTTHPWGTSAGDEMVKVWEKQSKSLDLSGKFLADLPVQLGNFTFLRELNLSQNFFDTIPEWILTWTQLKILDLRENCLSYQTLSPLKGMSSRSCKVYIGEQVGGLDQEDLDDLNDNTQKIRFIWERSRFLCCG